MGFVLFVTYSRIFSILQGLFFWVKHLVSMYTDQLSLRFFADMPGSQAVSLNRPLQFNSSNKYLHPMDLDLYCWTELAILSQGLIPRNEKFLHPVDQVLCCWKEFVILLTQEQTRQRKENLCCGQLQFHRVSVLEVPHGAR